MSAVATIGTENIINYIHHILSVENTINKKYGITP